MVPDDRTGGPRFAAFCERYVRHTKGRWSGQPFVLESWQREFWWEALEVDPATGLRVYTEVGLGLPRKNGKSGVASAAAHYFLSADGEAEPEVYVAAAARGQAGIVLGQARRMALQSPPLRRLLRVQTHLLENPRNGGVMRALSADAALQHGLNPSANIIDELHAHRDGALYTALTTGTLAREQPFTLWITTAGARDSFLGEMYAMLETGAGVEDRGALRIFRDRVNGVLIWWYGAPDDADIEDPAVWLAANPASWLQDGTELGREYARLRARGALPEWRTYHLNQFVASLEDWMPDADWRDRAGDVRLRADEPVYACVRVAHDHRAAAVAAAQRQGERVPDAQREQQDRAIERYGLVDAGLEWSVASSGRTSAWRTATWETIPSMAGPQTGRSSFRLRFVGTRWYHFSYHTRRTDPWPSLRPRHARTCSR